MFEVAGDAEVLAVQDLDVGQVEQVLGDGHGLGAGVGRRRAGRGGFVGVGPLHVAVGAGQSQVPVEGLDRFDTEAHSSPHLVADHDPQVAGVGELAHPATPGGQAGQRDTDGLIPAVRVGQAQRLDRRGPVHRD